MKIDLNKIFSLVGLIGLVISALSSDPLVRCLAFFGLVLNGWLWK